MKKTFDWCKVKKTNIEVFIDGLNKLERYDFNTMLNVMNEIYPCIKDIELKYHQEIHIHFLKNNNTNNSHFDEILNLLKKSSEFLNKHMIELYNYENNYSNKCLEYQKIKQNTDNSKLSLQGSSQTQFNIDEIFNNYNQLYNNYIISLNFMAKKEILLYLNLILNYFEKSEVQHESDYY